MAMGSRRFFNARGGIRRITTESSSSLLKRDMFRAGEGGKLEDVSVVLFHLNACSKSHMLPYFARSIVSSAVSQSSGQTQRQVPHVHVCGGSAYGWLFLTNDNLDMKLLNPFSGAEIQLPPVTTLVPSIKGEQYWFVPSKWSVSKAVFLANPSIEPRPVIFIIYNGKVDENQLAFCKPAGDKGWTHLVFSEYNLFFDVIYHKGQFYVLGWKGYVSAYDIGRCINDDDHSVKTTLIATPSLGSLYGRDLSFEPLEPKMRDSYLVVLDGELVKFELRSVSFHDSCIDETKEFLEREMNRDGDTSDEDCTDEESDDVDSDEASNHEDFTDEESDDVDSDDGKKECVVVDPRLYCVVPRANSCTYSIKIRQLDASEKQWVKMESLGDKAVFLGFNTSFAISASDYPTGVCIPDSVYFVVDGGGMCSNMFPATFYDMGIYNVKDKRLKPLYPQNASKFIKPAPI